MPTKDELAAALVEMNRRLAVLESSVRPKDILLTIKDAHAQYEPWAKVRLRSFGSVHKPQFEHHILPYFGAFNWNDVDHARADLYCTMRLGETTLVGGRPVSPRTINGEISTIRSMLNWCLKRRMIPYNPLAGFAELPEEPNKIPPISEDELLKLLAATPNRLFRLMMIFAYETGMRRDEWRLLRWPEVDTKIKAVPLVAERTKAREARVVPLSDIALAVLEQLPRCLKCDLVFHAPNRCAPVPKPTLQDWMNDARTAADLPHARIHGLRHGFGTNNAVLKKLPIGPAMDVMGHKDFEVHKGYEQLTSAYVEPIREMLNAERLGPRAYTEAVSKLIKAGG